MIPADSSTTKPSYSVPRRGSLKERKNITRELQGNIPAKVQTRYHQHLLAFFCEEPTSSLHEVLTCQLDARVRQCVQQLQDRPLPAKLNAGDLIAQEAKYHARCLASLYNKARDTPRQESTHDVNHGIAFAGLVFYIEEMRTESGCAPIFKLKDLMKLYSSRLKQLGTDMEVRVHSMAPG